MVSELETHQELDSWKEICKQSTPGSFNKQPQGSNPFLHVVSVAGADSGHGRLLTAVARDSGWDPSGFSQ